MFSGLWLHGSLSKNGFYIFKRLKNKKVSEEKYVTRSHTTIKPSTGAFTENTCQHLAYRHSSMDRVYHQLQMVPQPGLFSSRLLSLHSHLSFLKRRGHWQTCTVFSRSSSVWVDSVLWIYSKSFEHQEKKSSGFCPAPWKEPLGLKKVVMQMNEWGL